MRELRRGEVFSKGANESTLRNTEHLTRAATRSMSQGPNRAVILLQGELLVSTVEAEVEPRTET